jgi:hypothetical protein
MSPKKSILTMNLSDAAKSDSPVDFAAQWTEARLAYPMYVALANHFNFGPPPHPADEMPPVRPTREVFDRDLAWLDSIDQQVRAFQIRQLPPEVLNRNEEILRAFIHRQLRKPDKTHIDRDKIDLLLVQYFALCAPEELYRSNIRLQDVAKVLHPVLREADATPVEWCAPLDEILEKVDQCHSLRDMMELGLLEQGRLLKESAGHMFYDPGALIAFCRFNFLLRRAFIRLLHSDLSAVRQAVEALDAAGVKTVDCRRAGFTAAESTVHLRFFCEDWRQPFQKDYTESSVNHAFEQLLALRTDLEDALNRARGGPAHKEQPQAPVPAPAAPVHAEAPKRAPKPQPPAQAARPAAPVRPAAAAQPASPVEAAPQTEHARVAKPAAPAKPKAPVASAPPSAAAPAAPPAAIPHPPHPAAQGPAKPAADVPASPTAPAEAEKCLELIWEQLIAAPPSRGRSMSTIVLQDTKVLLSSWEVAAFVAEGGQEAEDLRRAVVARALLAVAMDQRKRSGDLSALASALVLARTEVSYFQGRIEQAKRAKNTEAAVNLGISTKRLLSFIEEAEKLQP